MEVDYQELKSKDYPGVKKLINELEGFDQFISDSYYLDKFLSLYLKKILADCSYCQVASYNGQIVGLIFGAADSDESSYNPITNRIKAWLDLFKIFISNSRYRQILKSYQEGIFDIYDQLLADKRGRYQGEIKLFIVSSNYQGLQIGTGLLKGAFDYFKEQGTSRIYLFTDTDCNYGYYDYQGFLQVEAKDSTLKLPQGDRDLMIFLYEYDL